MEQFSNADNQQASLCELSWLGGIIDGEGCLTFDKKSHKGRTQQCVSPTITIVNTEKILMNLVTSILKKNDIAYYYRLHPAKGNWKPKMEVIIAGLKRSIRLLDLITPYLVSKHHKAELLRQFCFLRVNAFNRTYSEEEKEICRQVWVLNGRGTKHW